MLVAAGTIHVNFFMMLVAQTYFLPEIVAVAPALVHAPFALFVAAIAKLEPAIRVIMKAVAATIWAKEILISEENASPL